MEFVQRESRGVCECAQKAILTSQLSVSSVCEAPPPPEQPPISIHPSPVANPSRPSVTPPLKAPQT